jgi:uncharacterized protein
MRYLSSFIKKDLSRKMVLIAGPRQVGKSTLAKNFIDRRGVYLNWDIRSDRAIIRKQSWPKDSSLVILDEIHKMNKWKNYLKGVYDEFLNKPPVLVTGSARLDIFRKAGDALTGRTFLYHMHPIDLSESKTFFFPNQDHSETLNRILKTGGFPESFLNLEDAERLRNDRFDTVVREDLNDLSRISSIRTVQLLVDLLRERVGGGLNISNLAEDLSVSAPTVKSWIELLEKLYLIFKVTPYSGQLKRSLQKESKVYFFDCGAAINSKTDQEIESARLENAVACALLKFCDFYRDTQGKNFSLHYFRDREKREVDFIVTLDRKPFWCVEVKLSDDSLSPSLEYIHLRLKPKASFQVVKNLDRRLEIRGIQIVPCSSWLGGLYE